MDDELELDAPNHPLPTIKQQVHDIATHNHPDPFPPEKLLAITLSGKEPYCKDCLLWEHNKKKSPPALTGICYAHDSEPKTMCFFWCDKFLLSAGGP